LIRIPTQLQGSPATPEQLYRVGARDPIFAERFALFSIYAPAVLSLFFGFLTLVVNPLLAILAVIIGFILGRTLPKIILRQMRDKYHAKLCLYLPVMAEQCAILLRRDRDLLQALIRIENFAKERECANPVILLLSDALQKTKEKMILSDALRKTAEDIQFQPIKHLFYYLSQTDQHGVEFSNQLRELANASSTDYWIKAEQLFKSPIYSAKGKNKALLQLFYHLTLREKLQLARLSLPIEIFRALEITLTICTFFLFTSLSYNSLHLLWAPFAGLILPSFIIRLIVMRLALRNIAEFDSDFSHLLRGCRNLLERGHDPIQALYELQPAMSHGGYLSGEITKLEGTIKQGLATKKALLQFGADFPLPDLELFVLALEFARDGADLKVLLERISQHFATRHTIINS